MMYDPSIGRWISEDPIGFEGGDVNLYRYVENSPVNYTDPTGLQKGVGGHVSAGMKGLLIAIANDGLALQRITTTWNAEAVVFAKTMAQKYGGRQGADSDLVENAVRHVYWQMLITFRYDSSIAKLAAEAHEAGEVPCIDTLIDQYHNAWAQGQMASSNSLFRRLVQGKAKENVGLWHKEDLHAIVAEGLWVTDGYEKIAANVIRTRIDRELSKGKEGPFILSWDDPRIKTLPGYDPKLPKTAAEARRREEQR